MTTKRRTADELKRDLLEAAEDFAAATSRMTNAENELTEAKRDRHKKRWDLEGLAVEIEKRLLEAAAPAEDRPPHPIPETNKENDHE